MDAHCPQGISAPVPAPRSAIRRGALTWLKLLRSARRAGPFGVWDLSGDLLKPGALIDSHSLPEPAILLECAGSVGGGRGHRRAPFLYVLWQFDRATGEWRELARVASVDADWTRDLGPIAARALSPPRPLLVDPGAVAHRLMLSLEEELEPFDQAVQRVILLRVYDELAARAAG